MRTSATIVFRNPLPKPVMEGPSSKTNLWWITCLTAISAGKRDASMVCYIGVYIEGIDVFFIFQVIIFVAC